MGLEIFYDLHAPADWPGERVQGIVEEAREFALTLRFAEVDSMRQNDPNAPKTLIFKEFGDAVTPPRVEATEGWYFRTWPGRGCETAFFGLCRFPATAVVNGVEVPTGWGEGWHYHTWCKTQYADRVSREHFLKCHRGVVAVLDAFRAKGVEVNARDASGYWDDRDEAELAKQLDEWNGIVAAVVGAIKDAAGEAEEAIASPILGAPNFERMELRGHEVIRRMGQEAAEAEDDRHGREESGGTGH